MNSSRAKITDVFSPGSQGPSYLAMIREIADECGDPQNPGKVAIMGPDTIYNDLYDEFFTALADEIGDERAKRVLIPVTGFSENDITSGLEPSFASRVMSECLCDLHLKGQKDEEGKWITRPRELRVIVSLYQDPTNRERFHPIFASRCTEPRTYFVSCPHYESPESDRLVEEIVPRGVTTAKDRYHSKKEFTSAPDLEPRIDGMVFDEEMTIIAGLPGDGKTFALLQVVKSLLTVEPLFGHFTVRKQSEKVIFLTPEASMRPFWNRLKKLGLDQFVGETLFVRTLTKGPIALDDPGLLEDARGADIFLDTLVRFNQGDENDASDVRQLSEKLFALQAAGARTIWASHHSVKTSTGDSEMTLENMVRGSGDLGAMISNCYALRKIDPNKLTVFVQCVKRRDAEPVLPFIVEGIDLRMTKKPGEAGSISDHAGKKAGRPEDPAIREKKQRALKLQDDGLSVPEIAEQLKETVSNAKNLIRRAKTERDAPAY